MIDDVRAVATVAERGHVRQRVARGGDREAVDHAQRPEARQQFGLDRGEARRVVVRERPHLEPLSPSAAMNVVSTGFVVPPVKRTNVAPTPAGSRFAVLIVDAHVELVADFALVPVRHGDDGARTLAVTGRSAAALIAD
jgi:hypothetical protein